MKIQGKLGKNFKFTVENKNKLTICNISCYLNNPFLTLIQKKMKKILFALILSLSAPTLTTAAEQQSYHAFDSHELASQEVLLEALKYVGVRYKFGGRSLSGLDCSGLVQLVFEESVGKELPRTARAMSDVGKKVSINDLKPGDLVFFNTLRRSFSHVGIYLGEGYFLHSPRKGAFVRVEKMKDYWMKRFNGARRIL